MYMREASANQVLDIVDDSWSMVGRLLFATLTDD